MSIIQVQKIMAEHPEHARGAYAPEYEYGSAFCNGRYVPIQDATVPLVDAGFLHADAAYDVVTVSRGSFFRLEDHLQRMEESCGKFFLQNPFNRVQVREILHTLVANTGLKDAYVWWCVTRGPLMNADRLDSVSFQNAMFAFVSPYFWQAPDEIRTRGFDLIVSKQYHRIHPKAVDPTAKNFHWMDMKLALFEAGSQAKEWAILENANGELTEAAGANVFVVKNGEVLTPSEGCLMGITRRSVFELAEEIGVKVRETVVTTEELLNADEAFTSTSAGGIMPIRSVDGQLLGSSPGPISSQLHDLYWQKRWSGWYATPVSYRDAVPE